MNRITQYKVPLILSGAALLFTLLNLWVDVQAIGPEGSSVAFGGLNGSVHRALGTSRAWYTISELLGYLGILTGACFACLGIWQWVQRKNLGKVDRVFFALAGLYALLIILWKGFDALAINYRPVLINGALEPSYPSTHTMLGVVFFGSAVPMIMSYMKPGQLRKILALAACCAAVFTILARLLSGYHWLTDIIGGLLISAAMLAWFWVLAKDS